MPEHRGIHIALVSQYDAMFIPEHRSLVHDKGDEEARAADTHNVDTFNSNYTASQFWIRYACDMATQDSTTRFFFFKLYVGGVFSVAWGCDAQDEWEGETSFAPSEISHEKLGLFFPRSVVSTSEVPAFEIRVYRAKARRRQERQYAPTAMARDKDEAVQYTAYQCSNIGGNVANAI
jgi:hypothetical protein